MSEPVRLSKLMSQRGLCSRREADKLIEQGLVRVNGELVNTLGVKFPEDVEIELTQRAQAIQNQRMTIMINKPVGYVSGQAEDDYIPAVRLITDESHSETDQTGHRLKPTHFNGLAPAGRLDIDSQGLLVLTQDGRIAKQLIGENTELEKEYLVRVDIDVTDEQIEKLTFGLELDGKPLKHAKVKQINSEQLQIILREGKKRQIRRMCEAVGLHVSGLKRVRVGELRLGKLEEGQWRFVLPEEFRHRDARGPERKTSGKVVSREDRLPPKRPKIKGKSLYGQGAKRLKKD
jgi:23S rRNA pseudouridine2604 synthase